MRNLLKPRRGFTLVELLVVIAIIGALVGLLLPAVQSAREAARRTTCINNLKQQGLALLNYHDVHDAFPIGVMAQATGSLDDDGFGWAVGLLPYLEEQALYETIAPDGRAGVFNLTFRDTGRIIRGGDTVLEVFRCPSSELPTHVQGSASFRNGYATSDYKGCNGWGDSGLFFKMSDGANRGYRKVDISDVVDGLSKTIAIGESAYYFGGDIKDWPIWMGGPATDEAVLFKTQPPSIINCGIVPKTINNFHAAVDDDCAFSWHDGGAYFAFADGSVHFVNESIDFEMYMFLGTKNDENVITDFGF